MPEKKRLSEAMNEAAQGDKAAVEKMEDLLARGVRDYRGQEPRTVVSAVQVSMENMTAVAAWCGGEAHGMLQPHITFPTDTEGRVQRAGVGDWIIRDRAGDFYRWDDVAFRATFHREAES